MNRYKAIILAWLSLFPYLSNAAEIERIDLRLFLQHSGELADPLPQNPELINVIIGGGLPEPSNSTLVDVVVSVPPGRFNPKSVVTLKVRNAKSGRLTFSQTQSLGLVSNEGKFHAAFLLLETGCQPLKLVATLSDSKKSVKAQLPFECGE